VVGWEGHSVGSVFSCLFFYISWHYSCQHLHLLHGWDCGSYVRNPDIVSFTQKLIESWDPILVIEEFRSLIGSIGYCSTALRYDISYAVSALRRHLTRTCKKVVDVTRRVIQYLLTSRDFVIEWKSSRHSQQDQTDDVLIGAADASFAMDTHTRRSHGGYISWYITKLMTGQSVGKVVRASEHSNIK
jgi:hypothetical protein